MDNRYKELKSGSLPTRDEKSVTRKKTNKKSISGKIEKKKKKRDV